MKGAFVVSADDAFYGQVEAILRAHGADVARERVAQVRQGDRVVLTVFGDLDGGLAADLMAVPDGLRGNARDAPPYTPATSCCAECSSEEEFVGWVQVIAAERSTPTWVLDGDGVLWDSALLEPGSVRL